MGFKLHGFRKYFFTKNFQSVLKPLSAYPTNYPSSVLVRDYPPTEAPLLPLNTGVDL